MNHSRSMVYAELRHELNALEEKAQNIRNALKELQKSDLTRMSSILAKVPGDNVGARANSLGISRQTYYTWLNGKARPNKRQAEKISRLTGVDLSEIRADVTFSSED